MTPNDFFSPLEGQSLLIPGEPEADRGQCVQSVGLYVASLGIKFPAYPYAYLYYNGIPGYQQVGAGNPILEGDIVVWRSDFPPSKGAGHIDVVAQNGTLANFVAWDSNWVPLKLAKVSHFGNDNNYIAGYLRRIGGDMPLTPGQIDKLIKMSLNREPTAEELGNQDYANNPGLAIDTFWENGGKQNYPPQTPGFKPYDGPPLFEKS